VHEGSGDYRGAEVGGSIGISVSDESINNTNMIRPRIEILVEITVTPTKLAVSIDQTLHEPAVFTCKSSWSSISDAVADPFHQMGLPQHALHRK
jgi:hypothetical protein